MLALLLHIPCQLTELWVERRYGQSQQMAQTCVSESAPDCVIDTWLIILIHVLPKSVNISVLHSALEIA